MKISVIIPCHNAADTIGEQLQAIITQREEFLLEIIVVDNNSTDSSKEVICSFAQKSQLIKYVEAFEGSGPAYARNIGAKAASGDAFIFCDADDVIGHDWLKLIVQALQDHDIAIGRIEFKKLNHDSWLQKFDMNHLAYEDEDVNEEDHQAPYPPYFMMVRGWGLGIQREYHEKIGGFDETLIAAEDLDYGFKAQQAGARVKFVKDAVLHYRLRATVDEMKKQWFNYGKYSALLETRYNPSTRGKESMVRWYIHIKGWVQLLLWRMRIKEKWEMGLYTRNYAFQQGILAGSLKYKVPPFK
ncbi:MAG: glycosyltransferase [Ardenticatenaceae bacterium]|nr:glycosyltransferase [Ardenticatenaceae bacterium]